MRPQELLGVFVRAAGLYLLLAAVLSVVALLANLPNIAVLAILVPIVQGVSGFLIVRSADGLVAFCYR